MPMMPITFTKKLKNEQFSFESHSNDGKQFFKVRCGRMGRPFIMIKDKTNNWIIEPGQNIEQSIQEIEQDLSNVIKMSNR